MVYRHYDLLRTWQPTAAPATVMPSLALAALVPRLPRHLVTHHGAGLDVDRLAGRMWFFFAVGMNFLTEICKLRAPKYSPMRSGTT